MRIGMKLLHQCLGFELEGFSWVIWVRYRWELSVYLHLASIDYQIFREFAFFLSFFLSLALLSRFGSLFFFFLFPSKTVFSRGYIYIQRYPQEVVCLMLSQPASANSTRGIPPLLVEFKNDTTPIPLFVHLGSPPELPDCRYMHRR